MNKFLVVGLGNPEEERQRTRHNIGWRAIDKMTSGTPDSREFGYLWKDGDVWYLKPTVGMNSSGLAVREALREIGEDTKVIVVVDDLDLSFGELRIKVRGTVRHNGLKSIEEETGLRDYVKVKVGIGHNFEKGEQLGYVLGEFPSEEEEKIDELLGFVRGAVEEIKGGSVESAQNKFNRKVV